MKNPRPAVRYKPKNKIQFKKEAPTSNRSIQRKEILSNGRGGLRL